MRDGGKMMMHDDASEVRSKTREINMQRSSGPGCRLATLNLTPLLYRPRVPFR